MNGRKLPEKLYPHILLWFPRKTEADVWNQMTETSRTHTHTHSKQCGRTDLSIGQIMTPFHFSVARLERPNLSCPVILVSDASVCYRLKVPTTAWRAGATVTQMEWKVKQKSFDKLHWDGRSSAKLGGGDATPSLYPSLGPFAAAADAVRYRKKHHCSLHCCN